MKKLFALLCLACPAVLSAQMPMYQSKAFSVYPDKVVQDSFTARVVSANSLTSNYQSPSNLNQSSDIIFKFALNGRDNEMLPGVNHLFTVEPVNGVAETPVIVFGKPLNHLSPKKTFIAPNTKLKVRVDMHEVLKQFEEKGFYTCYNGAVVNKQDFKGVFIAGNTLPMTWDFDNLSQRRELQLTDPDHDGIFETEIILNVKQDQKQIATSWEASKDVSAFPQYHSEIPLQNAVYNMSLEEMVRAVEPDSTFRTGKEWAGVWTRDISYSIILSMAYLQPRVAMYSLMKKVSRKKRIIQDTGTGGAWPNSTDRMVWAVAAWEVYKATGDRDWLQKAYYIIKNSIEDDMQNAYDSETGMVRGESSFLDWRDQTYPKWMQPADIFESECLGTNAVHYQANVVLSEMAKLMNEPAVAARHTAAANKIKEGINKYLWMPEKGYYAQYIYGRNYKMQSPRSEALGEALCILFGIADPAKAARMTASVPVTDYGITCVYPQLPDMPPYHSNAVWPFVQAYWCQAAAKAGNLKSVNESLFDMYRPAALFLTNKENFVADNGDYAGTVINSSNMLWSLSGNISLVHKVLFGIEFSSDRLLFHPHVPTTFRGKQRLTNFNYRNAVLDIELEGSGNTVSKFMLDGKLQTKAEFPASLSGRHTIQMVLAEKMAPEPKINKVVNLTAPQVPQLWLQGDTLSWNTADGLTYSIYRNGTLQAKNVKSPYKIPQLSWGEYQVMATDARNVSSFAGEPVIYRDPKNIFTVQVEDFNKMSTLPFVGFSGKGFSETSAAENPAITVPVNIPVTGVYYIDIRYSNGNGPSNTDSKCGIRECLVDNNKAGTFIFPQRGSREWSNWGYSNGIKVKLEKGLHQLQLKLNDYNDNMNGQINQAMLDEVRVMLTEMK